MARKTSLSGALITIVASSAVATIAMVIAAIVLKEYLYLIAGLLFLISGMSGIYVVRKLSKKINSR